MKRFIFSIFSLCLLAAATSAQTSRGTVTGTVTDPNGAVVTGTTVDLLNKGTSLTRTTTTNDAGVYRFDAVDLGNYDITIKSTGFKTVANTNIVIQANQTATIDVQLEPGTEDITIEIIAGAGELLQKSEPVRGGNFQSSQITQLPSANLNAYDLARVLPGVTNTSGGNTFGNTSQFSVNGQRPRGNNYLIDGVENNDISVTGPAFTPTNEDTIGEFSVQTGLFSAEFGRAGGGVFNLITKSGTNGYHGTLSERYLSQVFNAATNNDALSGLTRPAVFNDNIFGGTIGGPLPLPRFGEGGPSVTSGRDRTFFFFGLQYDRFRSTANLGPFLLPTAQGEAQLRQLFPAGTNSQVDLYLNSFAGINGVTNPTNIALGPDPVTGVDRGSIQFGQIGIPVSQIINDRQYVIRIDHNINERQILTFRYDDDDSIVEPNNVTAPGFTSNFTGQSRNFLATLTSVLKPNLTNELRFSFGRINFDFPISEDSVPEAQTLPDYTISGGIAAPGTGSTIPQFRKADNYLVQETVSYVVGKHTFRFGLEFLKQVAEQRPPFNERGMITYNAGGGFTAFANFVDDFSGSAGATNRNFGDPIYDPSLFRQSYFFQDTYKVIPTLTLTLGLRYENFGQPANNAFDFPAFAGFDPAQFSVPNTVNTDNNNLGPIFGFAYTPTPKSGFANKLFGDGLTVFRGGYQVSYDTFFNNLLSNIAADSPNSQSTTFTGSSVGRGAANLSTTLPATARTPNALDQQTSVFDQNIRNPYTQRFSFGFQRELRSIKSVLDISYVGSLGRKLFNNAVLNPIVDDSGARLFPDLGIRQVRTSGTNSSYNSLQARLDKRLSQGVQFNVSYTYSKLIDQVSEVFASDSSGTSVSTVPEQFGGFTLDRSVSDYDRPHQFVITAIYDLPGPRSGFLKQAFGGYQLSTIYALRSGNPYTILNGLDRNGDGINNDRPDIGNPDAPHDTRAVIVAQSQCSTGLRNPDSGACVTRNDVYVVQVAAGTDSGVPGPATIGRNTERTEITNNVDMSLFKNFFLKENIRLEFRFETFNLLNHPQFTSASPRNVTTTLNGQFGDFDLTNGGGRSGRVAIKLIF